MNKLVLTGFMGTGKTTLAKLLAEKLDLPLVDTDDLIAQRTGQTIPQIFQTFGEAGFRAWEAMICAELGKTDQPMVISTGGGALLNPLNRQVLETTSLIVCLFARSEVIFRRINGVNDRPLLQHQDPLAEIKRLQQERAPLYTQFRHKLDTSEKLPRQLVDDIIALWEKNQTIPQMLVRSPEGSYPLVIQQGVLASLAELFEFYGLVARCKVIVMDSNVSEHYLEKIASSLPNCPIITLPSGESYKNLETVNQLYNDLAEFGADRNSIIVALGGGVIGDTVGYVAATYMRGVRFVQIPTTLLSMVDSSVGGKVGVDIPAGKNLVGAFKQPDLVVIDPHVLETLPAEEVIAGMAEVIKHGFLANPDLLNLEMPMEERIRAAIQVKVDVVQRDPFEKGERVHLNLGHTFGHAIEQASGYTWRHGFAVGVGLVGAARLSERLGLLDSETSQKIEHWVQATGLPTRYHDLNPESIWNAMKTDKKWQDGHSHFVVLHGLGQPDVVRDVPREMVLEILEALREH